MAHPAFAALSRPCARAWTSSLPLPVATLSVPPLTCASALCVPVVACTVSVPPRTAPFHSSSAACAASSVTEAYRRLVANGEIRFDASQARVVSQLDALNDRLAGYAPPSSVADPTPGSGPSAGGGGGLFSMFGGGATAAPQSKMTSISGDIGAAFPRGVYMHGPPGCGKTYLMDLFRRVSNLQPVKRVHFNKFMLDIHDRLHKRRQNTANKTADESDLLHIAQQLVEEAPMLCFDEFQVLDIADAMVIRRLFEHLFRKGVVMVATSNRPPDDLYKNGLQRELFLPFIHQLKQRCEIIDMGSDMDYRTTGTRLKNTYYSPLNQQSSQKMEEAFQRLMRGNTVDTNVELRVMQGRTLKVPRTGPGIGWFHFDDLCRRAVAAADYLAITNNFHTVFVEGIPVMSTDERDVIRRFILLIDELYQSTIRLVCTAAAPPEELLRKDPNSPNDEQFAFDRCVSRLMEMHTQEYLDASAEHRAVKQLQLTK